MSIIGWIYLICVFITLDVGLVCLFNLVFKTNMNYYNPVWLYKNMQINIFGSIFIAILFNIVTMPYAFCYWLYKLCTVGRNKNE